jgi:hypothetical protein
MYLSSTYLRSVASTCHIHNAVSNNMGSIAMNMHTPSYHIHKMESAFAVWEDSHHMGSVVESDHMPSLTKAVQENECGCACSHVGHRACVLPHEEIVAVAVRLCSEACALPHKGTEALSVHMHSVACILSHGQCCC